MLCKLLAFALVGVSLVLAIPQAQGITIPPSPTGQSCSFFQDHWDCSTPCSTVTTTEYGIAATITDQLSFKSSLISAYSTPGVEWSGVPVGYYTTPDTDLGGEVYTAVFYFDSNALSSAGFVVTSVESLTTECPEAAVLPPSPTGQVCSPHVDHWHCEPTGTETDAATGQCEPHDDHWHCPPGVPEPTSPPNADDHDGHDETECTAHEDHWHCPEGVKEPPYPPGGEPETECTAHEDHWHCPEGVAEPTYLPGQEPTTVSKPGKSGASTASGGAESGGVKMAVGYAAAFGFAMTFVAFF